MRGLKFDTPFLFESDVDGSFGNSGSPVLNQRGEQIGVHSRGPREALYLTYEYDGQRCRGMGTHMAGYRRGACQRLRSSRTC
jgi:V8-like Glu-specific endopeptidase